MYTALIRLAFGFVFHAKAGLGGDGGRNTLVSGPRKQLGTQA